MRTPFTRRSRRATGAPAPLNPASGFDAVFLPGALAADNRIAVVSPVLAATSFTLGFRGRQWNLAANGAVELFPSTQLLATQGATVILCGRSITLSSLGEFGTQSTAGGATARFGAHVPFTDGTVYWDFGGTTAGATRLSIASLTFSDTDVWVFTTGPRGMEIWQNGILRASNSANPSRANAGAPWGLGAHAIAPTGAKNSRWWLVGYAGAQLSIAQIRKASANPYSLLKPKERIIFEGAGAPPSAFLAAWAINANTYVSQGASNAS